VTIGNYFPKLVEIFPDAAYVHYVRTVYYSDTQELIKYYSAIKVSSNAVRNIYKISSLSFS